MFLLCGSYAVAALGFIFQWQFVTDLWPLRYTNQTTFYFIGSIAAAAAASMLWPLLSREHGAFAGIALNFITIFIPTAIYAFQIGSRSNSLRLFGTVAAINALFGIGLLLWSIRIPFNDQRKMPRTVRWSFVVFVTALILVGGGMVLKVPNILPWDIPVSGLVLYGWMFLGASAYFAYALLRPGWHNSAGQLLGFLVYDLVLIIPFLIMLPRIQPDRMVNLVIYIVVIVCSGVLAVNYLFLNPATRILRVSMSPAATSPVS